MPQHKNISRTNLIQPTSTQFWISVTLTIFLCGCTSLRQDSEQAKEQEILSTQRALVINHLNRGMPTHALRELRPLVQKHPNDTELLSLMGLTHLAMRAPQRAIHFLQRAHTIQPTATSALNLSSAYIESGEHMKALKLLDDAQKKKLLSDYAYPERAFHNMGLALEKAGRLTHAMRYYRRALDENPDFYLTLMQIANLYEKQSKHEQARSFYRRARASCMRCLEPVTAMVQSYMKSGKPEAAKQLASDYLAQRDLDQSTKQTAMRQLAEAMRAPVTADGASTTPPKQRAR